MSALTFSEKIRALEPRRTDVCAIASERAGTLTLLIETGGELAVIKFDAAGWRALHAGMGVPPVEASKTRGRPVTRHLHLTA